MTTVDAHISTLNRIVRFVLSLSPGEILAKFSQLKDGNINGTIKYKCYINLYYYILLKNITALTAFNGVAVHATSSLTGSSAEITMEQTTHVESTTQPVTSSDNAVTTTFGMNYIFLPQSTS